MVAVEGKSGGARLHGNFDTSRPDGLPEKPRNMTEAQSQAWDKLMEQLPAEALRKIDEYLLFELTGYIVALSKMNQEWLANPADKDLRMAKIQYTQKVKQLSCDFGLSPADRKRIQIAAPQEESDELSEFM